MIVLAAAFSSIFLAAFAVGWWRYRSFGWNFVDLIYYPLAAVGIGLLFASNDVQRQLVEVNQISEQQHARLEELRTRRPGVKVLNADELLTSSINDIAVVAGWTKVCAGGSSGTEPRCLAVSSLGPHLDAFLKVARGKYATYEERLLAVCDAGDSLLHNIRSSDAMSSLVTDKLLEQYAEATSSKLSPLDYEGLVTQVGLFKDRAKSYVAEIHRLAFKPDDAGGQLLLEIQNAEIEHAEFILRGLFPCVTAPRAELSQLAHWTSETQTQQVEVERLEATRQRLKQMPTGHTTSLWLQLNLWPFVLLSALSLKFAKGVAALRRARESALATPRS